MLDFGAFLGICVILFRLSWTDFKYRIISNKHVLYLLPLTLLFSFSLWHHIFWFGALITLIVGFGLFHLGVIGAGDVKLLSVLMLAIPSPGIINFLFFTSLFGLGLIIVGWIFFRRAIKEQGLPYGIAISLGFISFFYLIFTSFM